VAAAAAAAAVVATADASVVAAVAAVVLDRVRFLGRVAAVTTAVGGAFLEAVELSETCRRGNGHDEDEGRLRFLLVLGKEAGLKTSFEAEVSSRDEMDPRLLVTRIFIESGLGAGSSMEEMDPRFLTIWIESGLRKIRALLLLLLLLFLFLPSRLELLSSAKVWLAMLFGDWKVALECCCFSLLMVFVAATATFVATAAAAAAGEGSCFLNRSVRNSLGLVFNPIPKSRMCPQII